MDNKQPTATAFTDRISYLNNVLHSIAYNIGIVLKSDALEGPYVEDLIAFLESQRVKAFEAANYTLENPVN